MLLGLCIGLNTKERFLRQITNSPGSDQDLALGDSGFSCLSDKSLPKHFYGRKGTKFRTGSLFIKRKKSTKCCEWIMSTKLWLSMVRTYKLSSIIFCRWIMIIKKLTVRISFLTVIKLSKLLTQSHHKLCSPAVVILNPSTL